MFLWLAFIICTSVIVYGGTRLSRYGDVIAEKTGLGRTWIGVVLMASVTSIPELVTGIRSVTYVVLLILPLAMCTEVVRLIPFRKQHIQYLYPCPG